MPSASPPQIRTTPGGLRVVCEPMPGVRSVALGVWIGVGSRFETPALAGVSHFLEHMLFKGTPEHSAEQIAQVFDGLGGEVNAMTGRDYTVVYMRVLDELVERGMPVIAGMVQRPTFADLDQERGVVIEEIAMYEDDPQDQVHDMLAEAVFPDQPLGRPIIGTREVIGSVPEDDVRGYHRDHYRAPNMVVAAAGNIDADTLVRLSEQLLGGLGRDGADEVVVPAAPGPPRLVVREKATEQVHLCIGGPGLSRSDPRRHAQSVLDTLLGGLMSSRLFQEVREKRGLAYSVGSYTVGYADTGQVAVHLGTREDNLATACAVIGDELRRLAEEPVPAEELRRAKDHLKGRLVLGLESPGTRMNRIGRALITDTELLTIDEIIGRVEAVTADDVAGLAREYWQPERLSAVAIGPDGDLVRAGIARLSPALAETAAT
ncbi:MAG TPA: pitrilysin family protein [Miltoncostaeaceae bacterium]|nr:pitrilysin family protein [Miltoncostaeaceae bacterium]